MSNTPKFDFTNTSTQAKEMKLEGYNWYDWTVFCSSSKEELNLIEKVEYHLHPSFPDPIRVVTDSKNGFPLKARGWGVFLIRIIIYLKDGTEVNTEHYLKFQ